MDQLIQTVAEAANRLINAFGGDAFQLSPEVKYRRVERLYSNAKRDQWDATERLPLREEHGPFGGLPEEERSAIARVFSQFYYGERGAQIISGQLCAMVRDNEAAKFLSSQCMDEARHVEAFERMLVQIDRVYPMNPFLNLLLTDLLRTNRIEEKLIGMNMLVEGLALSAFKFSLKIFDGDARYHNPDGRAIAEALRLIIKDESRHVGFGVVYLPQLLKSLSPARARSLQARQLLWMGLLFGSVRYHKRDSELVGISHLEILAQVLEEHQERTREMGIDVMVSGERIAQVIPMLDGLVDRVTRYESRHAA